MSVPKPNQRLFSLELEGEDVHVSIWTNDGRCIEHVLPAHMFNAELVSAWIRGRLMADIERYPNSESFDVDRWLSQTPGLPPDGTGRR